MTFLIHVSGVWVTAVHVAKCCCHLYHYPWQSTCVWSNSSCKYPFLLITSLCQLHCLPKPAVKISTGVWTFWQCIRARTINVWVLAQKGTHMPVQIKASLCLLWPSENFHISVTVFGKEKWKKFSPSPHILSHFTSEAFISRALMKCAWRTTRRPYPEWWIYVMLK